MAIDIAELDIPVRLKLLDQVKRDLGELGREGARTGQQVQSAFNQATQTTTNLAAANTRSLRSFNQLAFGVSNFANAVGNGRLNVQGLSGGLLGLSALAGGPLAIGIAAVSAALAIGSAAFALHRTRAREAREELERFRGETEEQIRARVKMVQADLAMLQQPRGAGAFATWLAGRTGNVGAMALAGATDPDRAERDRLEGVRAALVRLLAPMLERARRTREQTAAEAALRREEEQRRVLGQAMLDQQEAEDELWRRRVRLVEEQIAAEKAAMLEFLQMMEERENAVRRAITSQEELNKAALEQKFGSAKMAQAVANGFDPFADKGGDSVSAFFSAQGGNILSGFVSGITSAINPVGLLTGAFGQLTESLFGTGEAAAKARQAQILLEQQYLESFSASGRAAGFVVEPGQIPGTFTTRTTGGLERELADIEAEYRRTLAESLAAFSVNSLAWRDEYNRINALYDAIREQAESEFARAQLEQREDLEVRQLIALGRRDEADAMRLELEQRREYEAALREGADAATLAALELAHAYEKQRYEADLAARAIEEQLTDVRRVAQSLTEFNRSLTYMGASPAQTLAGRRSEFEMLAALAQGGDRTAAASLPEAARAFLDASRGYSASGMGFQRDLALVQDIIGGLAEQYTDEQTLLEQQLEELRNISEVLAEEEGDPGGWKQPDDWTWPKEKVADPIVEVIATETEILRVGLFELKEQQETGQREQLEALRAIQRSIGARLVSWPA